MGIRIDGAADLINATDGSLTIEGQSVNTTGIITASGGMKVGSAATIHSTGQFNIGVAATVFPNGNATFAGIVTAASFVGDGSGLTGAGPTLTGSTNNTLVTVTGSNAIAGEATLTYNGTDTFELQPASATPAVFVGDSNRTGSGQHLTEYRGNWNGTLVGRIVFAAGGDTTNKDDGIITMHTTPSGGSSTERLRIDSAGGVGINTDTIGTNHGLDILGNAGAYAILNVKTASLGHGSAIELGEQGDDDYGNIYQFASSAGGTYSGRMRFIAGTIETMSLAGGRVLVGTESNTSPIGWGNKLQVAATSAAAGVSIRRDSADTGGALLVFGKSRGSLNGSTVVQSGDQIGGMYFAGADGTDVNSIAAQISVEVDATPGSNDMPGRILLKTTADGASSPTERMRISASGQIGFNDTSPTEATVSIIQHDSSVTTTGLNIHTNGGSAGSGTQYALKITGTSQNDCPVYGIHIDKTQQYTQNVTGVYSKVTATYSEPHAGHFIVNGAAMNNGTYVVGIKGEVESDSGSNSNRTSRAVWGYNGTQQGSDTYAIQADTVTGGNGDLRGFQYLHGGSTKFYVNSSGNVWSASNSYSSDRDIKTDIQTLTGTSLNLIKQLVPKTFKWKESKENEKDGTIYKPDGATLTGFIAQEVQSIIPGIVIGTDGSKEMGINYQGLTAHLVNTIKELSSEIDTLKTKVAALESA